MTQFSARRVQQHLRTFTINSNYTNLLIIKRQGEPESVSKSNFRPYLCTFDFFRDSSSSSACFFHRNLTRIKHTRKKVVPHSRHDIKSAFHPSSELLFLYLLAKFSIGITLIGFFSSQHSGYWKLFISKWFWDPPGWRSTLRRSSLVLIGIFIRLLISREIPLLRKQKLDFISISEETCS